MNIEDTIKSILSETLQLGDRAAQFSSATKLFGSIAEFDSMAVVAVISALEEKFGIMISDEEITAETFDSVGSLSKFIERKLED
ncbi:MAG TPA: phosphopantetheine-binding protein [Stellaceae bacterium]|nr:phosphopantetheine-binding protein [Stellaceae bacterium]